MTDFFDQLWEQMQDPRHERQRAQYLEKIKTLIPMSPAIRQLELGKKSSPLWGRPLQSLPATQSNQVSSGPDFYLYSLAEEGRNPAWFRHAKALDPLRPFWRSDSVREEQQVLETRAMGADAFCLDVRHFDEAQIQYLAEVGRDYDLPAVLCCEDELDLARALQIQDVPYFWLKGILVAPQILELPWFEKKTLIFELNDEASAAPFVGSTGVSLCLIENK